MSAEAAALVHAFRVGRYTVTMTVPKVRPGAVACFTCEWAPEKPKGLTASEWHQYRAGRDAAIAALGLKALVVDL